ncbi:MAG: HlyC/CorC family transporter [Hyphomicrobiales bacterium]|nr:HlyC/CorC family transporter [Hyphomicrobiales bacterium]MBV9431379.1 HlyC/CorC family transporter [Hyphomicrobiales bacterium]MBV9740543.1 HlyC/CorC family transporter [Hyphomicrobiales bacterium]
MLSEGVFDLWVVLVIIFSLVLSAFFAAGETSLTATSRARMTALERQGNSAARLVNRLLASRERLIGAMLIGNNIVNIGASALTTTIFVALFGDAGVLYATATMSVLVVVFAEVLPKTIAVAKPDRTALLLARAVAITVALLGPILSAIETFIRALLRLFGVRIEENQPILSATEELRGAVDLLEEEGAVVKDEADMFGGLLDLSELEVSDVMVHRTNMHSVNVGLSAPEILQEVLASNNTRLPIWRDSPENIVGILHAKDVLRALAAAHGDPTQLDFTKIATEPWFVPDTTSLADQLKAFRARKAHVALVVDEYGEVMGLVTLEDILEEIVGDISDEHDVQLHGVRPQPNGAIIVEGSVPVRDVNRAMDWRLPDEDATTVAGLVIHEAQTIPDPGQAFTFHGYRFEVMRKHRNRITQLRVTPLGKQTGKSQAAAE